jgi:Ca-activated chloride channel homolog
MNEIEALKEAFTRESVTARPGAKQAAVAAALAAYDARPLAARQGSRIGGRLRIAASAAYDILTGKRPMRNNHVLLGGVSLAALTLAVVTAASLQSIDGFGRRDAATTDVIAPREREEAVSARQDETRVTAEAETDAAASSPAASIATIPAEPAPAPPVLEAAKAFGEAASVGGAAPQLATRQAAPGLAMDDMSAALEPMPAPSYSDQGRDNFTTIDTNPQKVTAEEPVSTFSIDVDTAAYSFMRAAITNGVLPQDDAVRVEELVNYFPYDYAGPADAEQPFAANVGVMETPWNAETKLIHIGIKGYDVTSAERPRANLVLLVDTSGSMDEPNKLPLLINSMRLLVDNLSEDDRVAIVAYAGAAGTVLEPTPASDKAAILAALDNLGAGGSTAGGEGIRQAYQLAEQSFIEGGINRVILATDGDFNVGITDIDELQGFVERERESGIFLSVLGFGTGNYNDALMQALAQNGNGAAAYIDTLAEARKVLVEEATSALFPIAKDVKIQVEFNPATVAEYRLIGYETRLLDRTDFNNDRVDAGEIGSGHTVTALYEIVPVGSEAALADASRYEGAAALDAPARSDEYAFLRLRYKLPDEEVSKLIETPIGVSDDLGAGGTEAREARFAASVAAFGQILRGGVHTGDYAFDDVVDLANANKGKDEFGYRAEFVNLVRLAKAASSMERQQQ